MANLDLSKYGITDVKEVLHNPSYDVLFAEETKPGLEGFEKGQVTELGAVNVMTGVYTGRSPKDKFFVKNEASENSVWWTSDEYKNDNKPCTEEAWADLKSKAVKQLSGKRLFVVDTFCGANAATRMKLFPPVPSGNDFAAVPEIADHCSTFRRLGAVERGKRHFAAG